MKKFAVLIAACAVSAGAHAGLVAKKGSKATLTVEYIFSSKGDYFSPSKDQKRKWDVRRVVRITATYAADAPQPFGVMHAKDPAQQESIKAQEAKVNATVGQMQPVMGDMMKIAADCNNDEKCIEQKVMAYANGMGKPDVQQKQAAIAELAHSNSPEYQLWRSTAQTGSYNISENGTFQVYELTCTDTKICKRTVTTQGSGPIPDPPGGRSVAGASMFEVDGQKGDLVLQLPVALQPLPTETVVESSIANDPTKSGKGFARPMLVNSEPITVKLSGDRVQASGTKSIPIQGKFEEGGTLTITWSLNAQ